MMIPPKSIVQLMACGPDERRKCNHLSLLSEILDRLNPDFSIKLMPHYITDRCIISVSSDNIYRVAQDLMTGSISETQS